MKPAPMSREQWLVESETRGHTVSETVRYLSDCADADDERMHLRALPAVAISPTAVPLARVRRWLRR